MISILALLLHDGDQLVVENQDQSTPDASQDVGEVALEEGGVALVLKKIIWDDKEGRTRRRLVLGLQPNSPPCEDISFSLW